MLGSWFKEISKVMVSRSDAYVVVSSAYRCKDEIWPGTFRLFRKMLNNKGPGNGNKHYIVEEVSGENQPTTCLSRPSLAAKPDKIGKHL